MSVAADFLLPAGHPRAYTYGQSQQERYVDENGVVRKRVRQLPRSEWSVLITEHHPGYIDWPTYEENLERIAGNTRPQRDAAGGAVREGSALLQGIATCGHCGRRLCTRYRGRQAAPGYHCPGKDILQGQGLYCLTIGGVQIDQAVSEALLAALQPAGLEAALRAAPFRGLLGVYSRCGGGREPGYPGPPAQIRTCALAHTAPTLGG